MQHPGEGYIVTKNLVKPLHGVALRPVVDVFAHHIVIARKVGIE